MQVLWDSRVVEAFGNDKGLLGGLKVQNVHTKEIDSIEASPGSLGVQSCRGLWQAAATQGGSELCLWCHYCWCLVSPHALLRGAWSMLQHAEL